MARLFDIHPASPQRRAIVQVADIVRAGGVIAYPTDSCYALGCQLGSKDGISRIRSIRHQGVTQALLAGLGEPLVSSTLLLPGQDEPMTQGWEIAEQLDHAVDAVIDSGDCGTEPTTVIDFSQPEPEIVRRGAGDTSGFE